MNIISNKTYYFINNEIRILNKKAASKHRQLFNQLYVIPMISAITSFF